MTATKRTEIRKKSKPKTSSRSQEGTAYHEAGHAVASLFFRHSVRNVTIIPDEMRASLGSVQTSRPKWFSLDSDYTNKSPRRAEQEIIVLFAGGAAEALKAVRRESAQAVAYWWGVSEDTVWKWRRALGIPLVNDGTRRLKHDYALEPAVTAGRKKALAKARDPVRRAKIAAARRGKPRPRHVIEAMIAAKRGRPLSPETRRKMSLAHKRRGTRPPKAGRPWTKREDALARSMPAAEVVRRTGRTLNAVYTQRRRLGVPDGRRR